MNKGYDQLINGFSIHIVIIGIMSLNVGSNIVLNSVVQLEAVLHTECYFTDTALKARLFPGLFLLSHVLFRIFFWAGKQTTHAWVMLDFFSVPSIFSGK